MTNKIEDDEDDWVSKTQRKNDCDDMQKLGEALITLKISELNELALPDELHRAIEEAHRIRQRGALKRHKQFIGKLMRHVDIQEIERKYDNFKHKDDLHNAHFKHLEKWRERIISEGDAVLNELITEFPQLDRQHLRQLIRKAEKEKSEEKPAAAYRQIFKYLRELAENTEN